MLNPKTLAAIIGTPEWNMPEPRQSHPKHEPLNPTYGKHSSLNPSQKAKKRKRQLARKSRKLNR